MLFSKIIVVNGINKIQFFYPTSLLVLNRYLVVFHPFVEQLTVFHISGLVMASSSIFRVLDLDLHAIAEEVGQL